MRARVHACVQEYNNAKRADVHIRLTQILGPENPEEGDLRHFLHAEFVWQQKSYINSMHFINNSTFVKSDFVRGS